MSVNAQRGAVLIVSLVFLLLLTLLATSSMQNATLQEKVAGTFTRRDASFQSAETALRIAEAKLMAPVFSLPACSSPARCLPPPEALTLSSSGPGGVSGMDWVATKGGFYGIQHVGQTDQPAGGADDQLWTLYRVTAIGIAGDSRTVLESIHTQERRVMWRQRQ
ncbi:pilus assembly PilX family protein [Pseudomonas petrae]|uniref:PilX N-terminal domain-containing pilus assembly protein n=2 Tax=Pseudomonas petrae TaxID=2912190 RepID=A0ABS9IE68_9PSED|nr:PilX N-terminal domain-containing pilus assembly protein [Pseudomonas petrae]MCF7531951.1 PilX N-terminal domain-containing pilus assembly protein [Pseudomonas petrae]MCF7537514.1 PilX N-terminal domain-containing pilus assembly protein [Pseudomonas petrae]MCF7545714.1 PilX N-terminal domain-containing pilus assembly protein [Pseudomonas petrae]MCF7556729.1 PilX N-terminal domain-containing pilus assembly protein [Pseudomonas petrae]